MCGQYCLSKIPVQVYFLEASSVLLLSTSLLVSFGRWSGFRFFCSLHVSTCTTDGGDFVSPIAFSKAFRFISSSWPSVALLMMELSVECNYVGDVVLPKVHCGSVLDYITQRVIMTGRQLRYIFFRMWGVVLYLRSFNICRIF